jgi:hypothetical protein
MARSIDRVARLFASDKPPFFLTIFFAALAWSITRYADSLATTPVIEYDVDRSNNQFIVRLENLSHDKSFSNLEFLLVSPRGTMTNPRMSPTPPAWEGDVPPSCSGQACTFTVGAFQPEWVFRLSVTLSDDSVPSVHLLKSTETIRLLSPSSGTRVVKYQYSLLFGLLSAWAIITAAVLFKGVGDGNSESRPSARASVPYNSVPSACRGAYRRRKYNDESS